MLLQASTGIGSSGTLLSMSGLSALAAKTATGGLFITESTSPNVLVTLLTNPVTAVPVGGLSTTTSGDVALTNTGSYIHGQSTGGGRWRTHPCGGAESGDE